MATESVIRQQCIQELLDDGWVLCVPTRSRFGSSRTYISAESAQTLDWTDSKGRPQTRKGTDDYFSIFDIFAIKGYKRRYIQYTSTSGITARQKKIQNFLNATGVKPSVNEEILVWGYSKGKFTHKRKYLLGGTWKVMPI